MERTCKNCNKMLFAGHEYCSGCGSRWVDFRLTPKKITSEFSERYLGTENVLLQTMLDLFRSPEKVIDGYIRGQRKKYVNPANFYFISLTLIGLQVFILKHLAPELLGLTQEAEQTQIVEFMNFFYDYLGLMTTLFIPIYAFTGWLVFLDLRKYNFAEHMVFFIYAFGLINIISVLFTPAAMIFQWSYSNISIALTPLTVLLIGWQYKRCFKISFKSVFIKALLAIPLFVIFQFIFILLLIVIILGGLYIFHPEWLSNISLSNYGKSV